MIWSKQFGLYSLQKVESTIEEFWLRYSTMAEVLKLVAVIAVFVVQVCFAFSSYDYESGIIQTQ
jgi:hypothetical protein